MSSICQNCGAPDNGTDLICKFCRTPINPQLLEGAIACPQCRTPNRPERQQCSACNCSLMQLCIFCNYGSPVNAQACQRCGEVFAGAKERKDQAQAQQVISGLGSVLGGIAGAVGEAITGGGHHHHHQHSYDDDRRDYDDNRRNYDDNRNYGNDRGNYGGGNDDGGAPPMDS